MIRKILMLSAANPTRAYSGLKYMYQKLNNDEFDITLWAAVSCHQKKELVQWGGKVNSFFWQGLGKIPKIRMLYMKYKALIQAIKYRNEVIICHELYFYHICTIVKRMFPKTKIIHYCTELYDENSPKNFKKMMKFYENNIEVPDLVIECDEKRRIYRKEKYKIKCKTVTIYNTLPKSEIERYIHIRKKENQIPVITYIGAAYGHRQLDFIINAIKFISVPYKLKLFVYGPTESIENLANLCRKQLGESKFEIIVNTPREEIFDKVYNSDIGIVYYNPTLSIGNKFASPTKFFEYISMGIPIVSSQNDSLVDIIDKYNVGLYTKENTIKSLYQCINMLLSDKKLRKTISENAIDAFMKYLNYEIQTKYAFTEIEKLIKMN